MSNFERKNFLNNETRKFENLFLIRTVYIWITVDNFALVVICMSFNKPNNWIMVIVLDMFCK